MAPIATPPRFAPPRPRPPPPPPPDSPPSSSSARSSLLSSAYANRVPSCEGRHRKHTAAVSANPRQCQNALVTQSTSHFSFTASVTRNHVSYAIHATEATTETANALVNLRYKSSFAVWRLASSCARVRLRAVNTHRTYTASRNATGRTRNTRAALVMSSTRPRLASTSSAADATKYAAHVAATSLVNPPRVGRTTP